MFYTPKIPDCKSKKKKGSKIDNIDQNNNTRAFQVSVEDDGVWIFLWQLWPRQPSVFLSSY
jgi:hypothetical protein